MKTVIPPFYERNINESDPFARDMFGRKDFARNITNLFQNTEDGLVITINSKWGDGKTTFIKLWERQLQVHSEFIPIYYDAFKNDFSGDAFLSISAAIHEAVKRKLEESGVDVKNNAQLRYLKDSSKELAKDFLIMGAGIAFNSITGGLSSNKTILDWLGKVFKKMVGIFQVNIDAKFEAHIKSEETLLDYQNKLQNLLESDSIKSNKKIIFFIDELDRCRPNFSVEVLEKVKHLFNLKNIFFVLSINKIQLLSTIGSVYGVDRDEALIYLQKFVHLETQLPAMVSTDNRSIKEFLKDLVKEYQISASNKDLDNIYAVLEELSSDKLLDLNPRAIERVMTLISIAINSCENEEKSILSKHIIPMASMKVGRPHLYESYKEEGFINRGEESEKFFKWFEQYYVKEKEERASNIFTVPLLDKACKLLDIYQITLEEPKEEYQKGKKYKVKL